MHHTQTRLQRTAIKDVVMAKHTHVEITGFHMIIIITDIAYTRIATYDLHSPTVMISQRDPE